MAKVAQGAYDKTSKGYVSILQRSDPKAWVLFEYVRLPKSRMIVEHARSSKLGYARPRKARELNNLGPQDLGAT